MRTTLPQFASPAILYCHFSGVADVSMFQSAGLPLPSFGTGSDDRVAGDLNTEAVQTERIHAQDDSSNSSTMQ